MKTVITDAFAVNPGDLSWDWLKNTENTPLTTNLATVKRQNT